MYKKNIIKIGKKKKIASILRRYFLHKIQMIPRKQNNNFPKKNCRYLLGRNLSACHSLGIAHKVL